jgi:hypothetical protein
MTVFSRLHLEGTGWGAIGWEPDAALLEPVIEQVRAAGQSGNRFCSQWMASVPT